MIKFIIHLGITSIFLLNVPAMEFLSDQFKHFKELEDAALLLTGPNKIEIGNYLTPPVYTIDNHLISFDGCSLIALNTNANGNYSIKFRCEDLMRYLTESRHFYLSGNFLGRLKGRFLLVSPSKIDDLIALRWDITTKEYSQEDGSVAKWAYEQGLKGKYVFEMLLL